MSSEPPPFQEAACCDICKCSFNTFRRRHHCRACGRTLCHEHSSYQMALPQFGVYSCVRVCSNCFNGSSRSENEDLQASTDRVKLGMDSLSIFDAKVYTEARIDTNVEQCTFSGITECKCGMPLCICEAPAPCTDVVPMQKGASISTRKPNPKPKKMDINTKSGESTSSNKIGLILNIGQGSGLTSFQMDYETNGEGLREAIKNGDAVAVKKLLSRGVDPNYCDKQGFFLLHLAALFNQTDIVFLLMEHGARTDCKNAQGETPLDCAPATLQFKMQEKIKECDK